MTAAANLDALRAAAAGGDRVAMLLLGDLAEEFGDGPLADDWRWLAGPPAVGWEQRAWEIVHGHAAPAAWVGVGEVPTVRRDGMWFRAHLVRPSLTTGGYARLCLSAGNSLWEWRGGADPGWRTPGDQALREGCPPDVRDACLAGCRLALADVSSAAGGRRGGA